MPTTLAALVAIVIRIVRGVLAAAAFYRYGLTGPGQEAFSPGAD